MGFRGVFASNFMGFDNCRGVGWVLCVFFGHHHLRIKFYAKHTPTTIVGAVGGHFRVLFAHFRQLGREWGAFIATFGGYGVLCVFFLNLWVFSHLWGLSTSFMGGFGCF